MFKFRSVNSIVNALAKTGTAIISIREVTILAQTNKEIFSHSNPRPRVEEAEDIKLIEAKIEEAPAT